jgi:hypothetical protein
MTGVDKTRPATPPFPRRSGKANVKPPAEHIEWRKLVSVPLDNATPDDESDWVGVVTKMPGALEGVTAGHLLRVQKRISEVNGAKTRAQGHGLEMPLLMC